MKKKLLVLTAAALTLTSLTATIKAEDELFNTEAEAIEWAELNTPKNYTYSIEPITISGVTAEPTGSGGYITSIDDEYLDSNWQYHCDETITIDGGVQTITFSPGVTEYNILPGDSGFTTVNIVNTSGDIYVFNGATHSDSQLVQLEGGFSFDRILSRLNAFDPTVQDIWAADAIEEDITKNTIATYITEERLTQYYNTMNGTAFGDLYSAWNYNFFNRCWSLNYSANWSDLDYSSNSAMVITWLANGRLTDNAYQNCAWSWGDSITITCPDIVKYKVTFIEKTPDPTPTPAPTPTPDPVPVPDYIVPTMCTK